MGWRRAAPQVRGERLLQQFALARRFRDEGLDRRGRFGKISGLAPPFLSFAAFRSTQTTGCVTPWRLSWFSAL